VCRMRAPRVRNVQDARRKLAQKFAHFHGAGLNANSFPAIFILASAVRGGPHHQDDVDEGRSILLVGIAPGEPGGVHQLPYQSTDPRFLAQAAQGPSGFNSNMSTTVTGSFTPSKSNRVTMWSCTLPPSGVSRTATIVFAVGVVVVLVGVLWNPSRKA
jgi:hypothetical protein